MTNSLMRKTANALLASLVLSTGLLPMLGTPVGAADVGDEGIDGVDIQVTVGSFTGLGATAAATNVHWLRTTASQDVEITVRNGAGTGAASQDNIVTVAFGQGDAGNDLEAWSLSVTGGPSNFNGAPADEDEDSHDDSVAWQASDAILLVSPGGIAANAEETFNAALVPTGDDTFAQEFVGAATNAGGATTDSEAATFFLGYDGTDPTLTVALNDGTTAADQALFHSEALSLDLSAVDYAVGEQGSGIASIVVKEGSTVLGTVLGTDLPPKAGVTGQFTRTRAGNVGLSLADGVHTLTVTATDGAGNMDEQTVTVKVDKAAPTLVVVQPAPNAAGWYNAVPSVSVTALDNGAGVASGSPEFRWGSDAFASVSGLLSPPDEGANALELRASDAAHSANVATNSRELKVDTVAPTIDAFALTSAPTGDDGSYTSTSGLAVSFAASDATSGVALVELQQNGGSYAQVASPHALTSVPEGSNTLILRVTDLAGNQQSQELAFDVDTLAPDADLVAFGSNNPVATLAKADDTVTLEFTLDEPATATGGIQFDGNTVGSCSIDALDGICTYVIQPGDNGAVSYDLDLTDAAGNVATIAGGGVTADTEPSSTPELIIGGGVSLVPGSFVDISDLTASAVANGDACEFSVDGTTFQEDEDCSIPLGDLLDGAHTVEVRLVDAAGNPSATDSASFTVDTVAPAFTGTSLQSSNTAGTLAREGDVITLAYTLDDGTPDVELTISGAPRSLDCDTVGDDTTCTYTLTGGDSGAIAAMLDATDAAGNAATQVALGGIAADTGAPMLTTVHIGVSGADAEANPGETITVSWTPSETLANVVATIHGKSATLGTNSASVVVGTTDSEGLVAFSIDFTDVAGNPAGATVVGVTDGSSVTVNLGDLVKTLVTGVSDNFLPTSQNSVISTSVKWNEDPDNAGPLVVGSPYPFARVALYDAANPGTALQTKTANSQGLVTFTVTSASVAEKTYVIQAIGYQPTPTRVVADQASLADRDTTIVFTQLRLASFTPVDGVLGKGETLDLRAAFEWAHEATGTPEAQATGLTVTGLTATVLGQPSGLDPSHFVDDVATTGTVVGFTEVGAGVYETSAFSHDEYESLRFTLGGGPLVQPAGTGNPASNFAVPTGGVTYAHWVGAYVSSFTAELGGDSTPTFVDLDETVTLKATVLYTPNYDPAGTNGLLATGASAMPVSGATVSFFETSHLDGTYATVPAVIDENADATTTAVTDLTGVATALVDKATFSQSALRSGANTYGVQALTTGITGIPDQTVDQDNADSLDADLPTLTFTALDLAFVTQTGAEDDGANPGDRWWLSMDNAKGALDTDPTDADAIDVLVEVTWRHDGAATEGATVKVADALGNLQIDDVDFTAPATDSGGQTTVTIDPDTFGLDALVTDLTFKAVSAPEPLASPHVITQTEDVFTQELLWSRIHVFTGVEFSSDHEVDLGTGVGIFAIPVYYHDEGNTADAFYRDSDFTFGDAVLAQVFGTYDVVVDDQVNAALTTADDGIITNTGLTPTFMVFAGCDTPAIVDGTNAALVAAAAAACTASLPEAGYHTYHTSIASAPHGLVSDTDTEDVLFTAVVTDATTDRLTAPVGTDITVTARTFYAHTKDAAGTTFPDTGFGAGNLPYTGGVVADVTVNAATLPDSAGLSFVDGVLTYTVPGLGDARRDVIQVATGPVADDETEVPLTLAYPSAEMERVWLSAEIALDGGRSDFTDRNLQVRGRDVDAYFDVTYTDGVTIFPVDGTESFAFTATDTNDALRFSRTLSTAANLEAPTIQVVGPGETPAISDAVHVTGEGGCTDGCWKGTITGFDDVAADQAFTLSASIPLTADQAGVDVATTVADTDDGFEVDFTALELATVTAGNVAHQADLGEFWYNQGSSGSYLVTATWAHDGSAATGAMLLLEDADIPASALAGATVVETLTPGTYTVTVPSPSESRDLALRVVASAVPSTVAGEAVLTDGTPFSVDADSLTETAATGDAVFTRAVFTWGGDYDGRYVNKAQSALLGFDAAWEHSGEAIDVEHGWELTVDDGVTTTTELAGVDLAPGIATGFFDVTRLTSGTADLTPSIYGDTVPRGITAVTVPDSVSLTWTAILVDVDDGLEAAPYDVGTDVLVRARTALEHAPTGYLAATSMTLLGTAQTTAADGFAPSIPGASVTVNLLTPGQLLVIGEGVSHNDGLTFLDGTTAITSSVDDMVVVEFE